MEKLIIVGAGGQGRETAQLVKDINKRKKAWDLLGYVDDRVELAGRVLNGFPVLGSIDLLKMREFQDVSVISAIGDSKLRKNVIESIENELEDISYAKLIHPSAVIGDESSIDEGTAVCANTVITTNVKIGKHVIVNYGSTVGHDTELKDFVTVLPGTNVSGNVKLRKGAYIGSGTTIIPEVEIGEGTIVGAGAVVTKDLPAHCTAVGLPAKPIKYHYSS